VSTAFTKALAREEERRQKNILAELDRQKIVFFQNISHELRSMYPFLLLIDQIGIITFLHVIPYDLQLTILV